VEFDRDDAYNQLEKERRTTLSERTAELVKIKEDAEISMQALGGENASFVQRVHGLEEDVAVRKRNVEAQLAIVANLDEHIAGVENRS